MPKTISYNPDDYLPSRRLGGFTRAQKVQFLHLLSQCGNVRQVCGDVGLSPDTAYLARRRDSLFAEGWNAAMALALDHAEQILADRAQHGIEETVWFKGQVVGHRTRFDTRLFLAHLARLDRYAGDEAAQENAGRFDEMLALIGGASPPPEIAFLDDWTLPHPRKHHLDLAGANNKRAQAAEQWDEWHADAVAAVDNALDAAPIMEYKSALPQKWLRACPTPSGC